MVGSNKVPSWEKMPSLMSKNREGTEASMSLLIKMPLVAPKKSKGKEKVLDPNEEPFLHVNNLHSSKESNDESDFLIIPLDRPSKERRGKRAFKCP